MSGQISLQLLLEVIRCGDRDRHPKAVKALSCDQTLACVVGYEILGRREILRIGCQFPKRRVGDRDLPLG